MQFKFTSFMNFSPIMKILSSSMIILPTPTNINNWWNMGSILGMMLSIQIISGLLLSLHYCPSINLAFNSVIHISKDINLGWLIRLIHMNGASFYFIFIYLHIARGLYYHSYKLIPVWILGVMILLLSMMTAFLGYVLPWGQMSFWGATVITNLLSAIPYVGSFLVQWIWGGFSINNATLNRFYSFHFILPLIILLMVIFHLFFLHLTGSNNPLNTNSNLNKIPFYPYFIIKDLLGFTLTLMLFLILIMKFPYMLSDPDNFLTANPMVTPEHIKPEWYFLFAYTILRVIPNKLGGVIGLMMSILILLFLPIINNYNIKTCKFYMLNQILFMMLFFSFIMLTWLGNQAIEYPYTMLSMIFSLIYFTYFLTMPYLNMLWDKLLYKH